MAANTHSSTTDPKQSNHRGKRFGIVGGSLSVQHRIQCISQEKQLNSLQKTKHFSSVFQDQQGNGVNKALLISLSLLDRYQHPSTIDIRETRTPQNNSFNEQKNNSSARFARAFYMLVHFFAVF